MKLDSASRITRDGLPDAPAGEWIDLLLEHVNQQNEQITQALQQNLTIADNLNAAIVTHRMVHGVERTIKNPLKVRPVGIKAIRSTAINGGTRYRVDDVGWRFIDPPDPTQPQQLGITVNYAAPHGICAVSRSTNQSIATGASPTAVQFDAADIESGSASWDSGANTQIVLAEAGIVRVTAQALFDTAAGGYRLFLVRLNGAGNYAESVLIGGDYAGASGTDLLSVSAGDYLTFEVAQTTAGALNILASDRIAMTAEYVACPVGAQNDVVFVVYGG